MSTKGKGALLAACFLLGSTLLAFFVLCMDNKSSLADSSTVTRGKILFEQNNCGQCHDKNALPLSDLTQYYTQASLKNFLSAPTPPMPTPDLSDSERTDLTTYLLAEHP